MQDLQMDVECRRLRALERLRILYSEREPAFDALTSLVREVLGADFALITLIDEQHQWIKSGAGTDMRETDRSAAFCDRTIRRPDLLEVSDARDDPRFAANPLVTGAPFLRSYLGCPLTTAEGYRIGAVCVLGLSPRTFSERDRATVRHAATVVMEMFEMRCELEEARPLSSVVDRTRWEALLRVDLARSGDLPPVALVGVDAYDPIAQSHGQKAADRVLSHLMDHVADRSPPATRLARLGASVFGAAMPGLSGLEALHVLETVRETAGSVVVDLGSRRTASSTVSIGVIAPSAGETAESLMARADSVLEAARAHLSDSLSSQIGDEQGLDLAIGS